MRSAACSAIHGRQSRQQTHGGNKRPVCHMATCSSRQRRHQCHDKGAQVSSAGCNTMRYCCRIFQLSCVSCCISQDTTMVGGAQP
jgi:hypothetical protein